MAENTLVGLAGWSYADWKGIFYPAPRPKGFLELRHVAEHFDCVEVNATFYREVPAATMAKWAQIVRDVPQFASTVKANQELTHSSDTDDRSLRALCGRTRESLLPLEESGRLGGLLLQFPWYFGNVPKNRERLSLLAEELFPLKLIVEVRHRSFQEAEGEGGLRWFETLGLNLANIDLPRSSTSPSRSSINTGPIGYFRLHGRNRKAWFDKQAGRDEKYDYLYSQQELKELLPTIERVAARTELTYVIANNHYRGQAPANAFQLLVLLGRKPPDIPTPMQTEFPFLASLEKDKDAP